MDMKVSLLFLLPNTLLLFNMVFCQSREILFNLKDPESNEVISVGQENVALVCHITNTANADITIRNVAGESVATNMNVGNCLEHTISRLTEEDNGNYVCQIQYMDDVSMVTTIMEKFLLLNVVSGDQQCFRNGTTDQAFGVGDTLLLSCYCTSTISCNWISVVVGTNIGTPIPVYETVEFDGKKQFIRVIVGPLLANDTNTRYDCFHGSQSPERCEIGPTTNSSNDFVLNAVNPSTILRECPRSEESSVTATLPGKMTPGGGETKTIIDATAAFVPTVLRHDTPMSTPTALLPENLNLSIIIVQSVVIILLIALVIVLGFIARKRISDLALSLIFWRDKDRPDDHALAAVTPTGTGALNDLPSEYASIPGKNRPSTESGDNRAGRDEYEAVSDRGPGWGRDEDSQYEKPIPVAFGPGQYTTVVRE